MRLRFASFAALFVLLAGITPVSGAVTVVRVSSTSPFPIGDCRPDDTLFFDDGTGSETDPSVAINPTNPDNIVVAYPAETAYGIVAASSFDGGQTWTRTVVPGLTRCTGGNRQHMLHARLSFGGDGRLYLTGEALEGFFPDPRSFLVDIPVVTSMDGGLTWSTPSQVDDLLLSEGFDRIAAEPDIPGAAVVAWHGPEGASKSFLSRTTDGGRTWVRRTLPSPALEFQPFQSVLVAPDGALYVFHATKTLVGTLGLFVGGVSPIPLETDLYVTRSDDTGVTWSPPRLVMRGVSPHWVGTAVGADGAIFTSTWRGPVDDRQLLVFRSVDRGETWIGPTVVAEGVQDPFPMIAADPSGTLGVTYMVSTPGGRMAMFARSSDGGLTWSEEVVDGPFPAQAFGYYQETVAGPHGFATAFIRGGPDTDGPTDVFVALIT